MRIRHEYLPDTTVRTRYFLHENVDLKSSEILFVAWVGATIRRIDSNSYSAHCDVYPSTYVTVFRSVVTCNMCNYYLWWSLCEIAVSHCIVHII